HMTKAEVNIDSLTGSFSIPDRKEPQTRDFEFSFAMDEKGIVFIDDAGYSLRFIEPLVWKKRWKYPGLERFLYDFLENILSGDLTFLESLEKRLSRVEDRILDSEGAEVLEDVARIRGDLLAMRTHYEQLLDLGQELDENENGFFKEENLRYFSMFCARIMRLQDYVTTLREISVQVRDLYQSQLSEKQNRIMTILTVVTTIFTPLTLVTGWYGMNFKY
ncbi:MAG: magnesium transporter CorA family protein, partial [bacterium]